MKKKKGIIKNHLSCGDVILKPLFYNSRALNIYWKNNFVCLEGTRKTSFTKIFKRWDMRSCPKVPRMWYRENEK